MAEEIKKENLRELSLEDLEDKLADLKEQYQRKQFAHAVSPLENPLELRWTRKDIARINTELRRRELEDNK